jgi:hypothetical protein
MLGIFLAATVFSFLLPFPIGSVLLIATIFLLFPVSIFVLTIVGFVRELHQENRPARDRTITTVCMIALYGFVAVGLLAIMMWRYSAIAIHV